MSAILRTGPEAASQPTWLPSLSLKAWLLGVMQLLCVLCFFIQLQVDASTDNLVCTALVCFSTTLLVQYLWRSRAMQTHPISSFALLGLDASCQFVALVTQSMELAPFVHQLRVPLLTFSMLSWGLVVAILAHVCHRHFLPLRNATEGLAQHVFGRLQLHRIPLPHTLWIFGAVGIFAMLTGGGNFGDAGGKFLAAFAFMMWAPFLMPLFQKMVGGAYCDMRKHGLVLILYFGVIIVIGLVKNYRAVIFAAPVQVMLTYVIVSCWRPEPLSPAFMRRAGLAMLMAFLLAPVFGDVVTAMEIARGNRDKATPAEMLQQTGEAFMDKKRLTQYREAGGLSRVLDLYDEQYLSNPMMGRFTETKFHDNMLYFGQYFSEQDREALIDNEVNKAIAIVPQNFIDALDIQLKKEDFFYSNGDYYLNLSIGGHLGGFATGSMWADLYVIFGNWWPCATFAMLIIVFITMDAFADLRPGRFICVSTLCHTWQLFLYGISSESIVNKFNQVTRGLLQEVLVYGLLIALCVFALKLLKLPAFVPLDDELRTPT